MKILWINPSFLDYRVPVYAQLNAITNGGLTVLYSKSRVVPRVQAKIEKALGGHAVGLAGEKQISLGDRSGDFANTSIQLSFQPGLISAVFKSDADVMIVEGFFQWSTAGFLRRMLRRTPLVLSYERTRHTERNCPAWRRLYRKCCVPLIDSVLANGMLCKEYLTTLGIKAQRIVTGGMVADTDQLQVSAAGVAREQAQGHPLFQGIEGPVFLYVGQMIARKGIRELLAGWAMYKSQPGGVGSLVLIGQGPAQADAERMIADQNIAAVRLGGAWNYDQIHIAYAAADAFVIATLEDNWSLVVPEAMACGLPVLTSIYNGCHPELIEDGDNGKLFDPLNGGSVAAAFAWCSRNREGLKAAGRRSVEIINDLTPSSAAQAAYRACELALGSATAEAPS